jgi:prepilin-type N-terminal cleavage/methylation domain-containing protein
MQKRGFTVIELVIAIVVIAVLSVLTIVYLGKARAKSKLSRVATELSQIAEAVTQYAEDNNYQYPPDVSRNVPPGLEKYLENGTWPKSVWPHGVFDWDNWVSSDGQQVYQISYRLCDTNDPIAYCSDSTLFPNFVRNSAIYYCISGPCAPHKDTPTVPGYCVNCKPPEQNY